MLGLCCPAESTRPVRAYGSVGGAPRSMVSARGAYVTDIEGREYVDLITSWGPAILGHAHPSVIEAVQAAAARGLSFGASTSGEAELAELVIERVGSLVERLRLVSTGTEATMTAIRLARGATGRDLLVKFAGHYHGHSDGLLAEAGSGLATLSIPGSAGVPAAVAAQTIVIPTTTFPRSKHSSPNAGSEIAAVITEAAAANMGVVAPQPGFNAELTRIAHEHGALVIIDEVLTGFRVGPAAGWWGLDPSYQPDLVTFGKVIGGGLPLAALGGRADVMNLLAPLGPVYQAGTLSGNPVAVAAGIATLRLRMPRSIAVSTRRHPPSRPQCLTTLTAQGVAHSIQHAGNLFSVAFREDAPSTMPT